MTAPAVDVTGVFKEDFAQMFPLARPMKANIDRFSKPMRSPLEDGSMVIDHRVIEPISISLLIALPNDQYKDIYAQIQTSFVTGQILTVTTKVNSYPSMFISEMPHEETTDEVDLVKMVLKLEEAMFVKVQFQAVPARPRAKSTVKRGEQAPKSSVLYDIFH